MNTYILIYLIAINLITFLAYVIDKKRAIQHKYRISEKTLLGLCLIGGSLGGLVAMYTVRHKTKHLQFVVGVPVMLIINVIVVVFALRSF